jgi:hypothetical protein
MPRRVVASVVAVLLLLALASSAQAASGSRSAHRSPHRSYAAVCASARSRHLARTARARARAASRCESRARRKSRSSTSKKRVALERNALRLKVPGASPGTAGSAPGASGSTPAARAGTPGLTPVPVSLPGGPGSSGDGASPVSPISVSPQPAGDSHTAIGMVSNADPITEAPRAAELGAKVVRVEFEIGTPVSQIEPTIAAFAENGERALLLAGFYGRIPTGAEAASLASWAKAFGTGGTFWAARSDGELAVQDIEFGNETNQAYQFNGCSWDCAEYVPRAESYARALKVAQEAVDGAQGNPSVGLLAIGDDGGTGSPEWVDGMLKAVPDLGGRIAGWTAHAYGPEARWKPMIDHLIQWTAADGAPELPIYVTEFGFSTDGGTCLDNNYGWNDCMSYQEAASSLSEDVGDFLGTYGSRIAELMLYQVSDQWPAGETTDSERYFGALQSDGSAKGAYTATVHSLLAEHAEA